MCDILAPSAGCALFTLLLLACACFGRSLRSRRSVNNKISPVLLPVAGQRYSVGIRHYYKLATIAGFGAVIGI